MHLAIDLGDKRCGIAIEVQGISMAKKIVPRVELVDELKVFCKQYPEIDTFVVGLPYDLYNKDKKQLGKTEKFMSKLPTLFPNIKTVGFDERFTSFEADNILSEYGDLKGQKKDDISAALILEGYLRRSKQKDS